MTSRARRCLAIVCVVTVAWLQASTLAASESIRGQVLFGGLPVPGAEVSITNGDVRVVTTSLEDGTFRLAAVDDGPWMLRATMPGFGVEMRDLTVPTAGEPLVITLTLLPFETMTRSARPLDGAAVARAAVAATSPPAAPTPTSPQTPDGRATGPVRAGATEGAAGFRRATTAIADAPRADTVDEPDADATDRAFGFGTSDGLLLQGSVNNGAASPFAQLASFGNNRRGRGARYNWSVGSMVGLSAWDARPFSFSSDRARRPDYRDLQFMGTFSGPLRFARVLRNGPMMYVSYQRSSEHAVTGQSTRVPTLDERLGDFSRTRVGQGGALQVVDPFTSRPFPDARIPAGRISPQAAALLAYYPLPNVAGDSPLNHQAPVTTFTRQQSLQTRATQVVSQRSQLVAAVNYQRSRRDLGHVFGFDDAGRGSNLDAAATWFRRYGLSTSVRVRYQLVATTAANTPFFADRRDVSADAGIVGNGRAPRDWGLPALMFASGVANLGTAQANEIDTQAHRVGAEVVRSEARHVTTAGVGVKRTQADVLGQQDARGTLTFTGGATGYDLADFLLGLPRAASLAVGNPDKALNGSEYDAHVNDDWRVSPTLTINAGVRWEYESPRTERLGRLANLDLARDLDAASVVTPEGRTGAVTGRTFPASLVARDWRGLQPRVGVAWRPEAGSSLVVRAGYGVYRNTAVYQALALLLAQQPPFSTTFNVEDDGGHALTIANAFLAPSRALGNTIALDPAFRVGGSRTWQVSAQRDLPASLTVTATYTGSSGRDLPQAFLPNTSPPGGTNACPTCPRGFVYLTSDGRALRNALQVQVRRRLRQGLSASLTYTLAKATDDAATLGTSGLAGASIAQDWRNIAAEKSASPFDQRHLLIASFQYTTGVDVGGGSGAGLAGRLLRGWTLAAQVTAGSGLPLTPVFVTTALGTGIVGTVRANVDPVAAAATPAGLYANPAAFSPPLPGQWGSAGRYSVRGPAQALVNASIGRSFLGRDRFTLDWRIDATNVINQVTFAGVDMTVGSPQFGRPTRANPMRRLQTSLRARF